MSQHDFLQFELSVMDFAEMHCEHTKEALEIFSMQLHEAVEIAMCDYAYDKGIEDYDPQY